MFFFFYKLGRISVVFGKKRKIKNNVKMERDGDGERGRLSIGLYLFPFSSFETNQKTYRNIVMEHLETVQVAINICFFKKTFPVLQRLMRCIYRYKTRNILHDFYFTAIYTTFPLF